VRGIRLSSPTATLFCPSSPSLSCLERKYPRASLSGARPGIFCDADAPKSAAPATPQLFVCGRNARRQQGRELAGLYPWMDWAAFLRMAVMASWLLSNPCSTWCVWGDVPLQCRQTLGGVIDQLASVDREKFSCSFSVSGDQQLLPTGNLGKRPTSDQLRKSRRRLGHDLRVSVSWANEAAPFAVIRAARVTSFSTAAFSVF